LAIVDFVLTTFARPVAMLIPASAILARMPMIVIVTNNSIKVKPAGRHDRRPGAE
jgi:hypothetical protein